MRMSYVKVSRELAARERLESIKPYPGIVSSPLKLPLAARRSLITRGRSFLFGIKSSLL